MKQSLSPIKTGSNRKNSKKLDPLLSQSQSETVLKTDINKGNSKTADDELFSKSAGVILNRYSTSMKRMDRLLPVPPEPFPKMKVYNESIGTNGTTFSEEKKGVLLVPWGVSRKPRPRVGIRVWGRSDTSPWELVQGGGPCSWGSGRHTGRRPGGRLQ